LLIDGYFSRGIADSALRFIERFIAMRPTCICSPFTAGAPAMMASKSAGKRTASVTPWRPPCEQPFQIESFGAAP
jgi:hypothetical protein